MTGLQVRFLQNKNGSQLAKFRLANQNDQMNVNLKYQMSEKEKPFEIFLPLQMKKPKRQRIIPNPQNRTNQKNNATNQIRKK
ncbi:hypothetical protein FGO68_gene9002 [Halteria grandinella]|uniref:Uncharacterized protein n=1 Tax=Halteria grandinella TaxID=5974 RepID=A0A8J8NEP5_HALGN|nr:hypothetical protein FGO68_gene9002 [Halteria grandinella]